MSLSGNLSADYQAIQPYIQQVVNTGQKTSLGGNVVQYVATISGQQIVVRGIELENNVFQISDAWVVK